MRISFPKTGRTWNELSSAMDQMAEYDIDWRRGRAPLYVFYATDEVRDIGQWAFNKFFTENALGGRRAFFGLGRMEEEIVDMSLDLFVAPKDAAGHMTTGGSESLLLAVKTAREWYRHTHGNRAQLNIVVPYSAHPAFNKAAEVMDLEVRRVALGKDLRADPDGMDAAIDECTIMVVGSAPCFPHGVIDPIAEIAELALSRGVWLHVDACVGGYVAPFVRRLGYRVPDFDFSVAGVRSLSADLHKFGFCPKPASVLLYRHMEDMQRQVFDFDQWSNGRFTTPTLTGTRPGGAVAAAWAVLNYLGEDGYQDIAARLMQMTSRYVAGISAIDGLELWVEPDLTIVNFGSRELDIFAVAEFLSDRGWLPGLTQQPRGLHLMLSLLHDPVRDEYLECLREAVRSVRASGGSRTSSLRATY